MTRPSLTVTTRVAAAQGELADRVAVVRGGDSVVLVVADGAGNSASGRLAAEAVVADVQAAVANDTLDVRNPESWTELLASCDRSIAHASHGGETTAVVVCISEGTLVGASVGDSMAWVKTSGAITELTEGQHRKPLLGSGRARPVSFMRACTSGTVLAATDGLSKYVALDRLRSAMDGTDLEAAADELIAMPRMLSGRLQDDVGLVLCRFGTPADSRTSQ